MKIKFMHIFGFIMSFFYVFIGLIFMMTPFMSSLIENPQYRKIMGGALMGYGMFRVVFFFKKMREKKEE